MFIAGFDNNGILAPAVNGFTKIVDNLSLDKNIIVSNQKIKQDAISDFKPIEVNLSKIIEPLLQPVNDLLNFNKPKKQTP